MTVCNMESSSGHRVPNQFIITHDDIQIFQSYQTAIAKMDTDTGKIQLDKYKWDYSRTTAKYRNIFTGLTTKQTIEKINSGEIELVSLN